MDYFETCKYVKDNLKKLSLDKRVLLFKKYLKCPIDYKDGIFLFKDKTSDPCLMSDYLEIREYWMNHNECNDLKLYFENNIAN
jgi:hypothetical protein